MTQESSTKLVRTGAKKRVHPYVTPLVWLACAGVIIFLNLNPSVISTEGLRKTATVKHALDKEKFQSQRDIPTLVSSKQQCNFHNANGSFQASSTRNPWNTWSSKQCRVTDYLQALYYKRQQRLKTPLSIVLVGDSLERRTLEFFCNHPKARQAGYHWKPNLWEIKDKAISGVNQAPDRQQAVKICSNSLITIAHFKILGMSRACTNGGFAAKAESRLLNVSSAERLRQLFPIEILNRIDPINLAAITVGSSLWDLSEGCNNQVGVTDEYQSEYVQGIHDLHQAFQDLTPRVPLYWRTSPPITPSYDRKVTKAGWGRTRENTKTLNRLLRQTVEDHNFGTILDWHRMLNNEPAAVLEASAPDGKHYSKLHSLAYLNLFFNALTEGHPEWKLSNSDTRLIDGTNA